MNKQTTTTVKNETASTFKETAPASDNPLAVLQSTILTPELARSYGRMKANAVLKYSQEKQFFMAIVQASKDLSAALPQSLHDAFLQAASMGLSFNPLLAHCYIIPRRQRSKNEGESWADYNKNVPTIAYASPGYRGLLHLAVAGGAIKYGRAEVVHERDHFRYLGPTSKPEFIAGGAATVNSLNVNRGARVGVFCHAKTLDGEDLCDMMDAAMIEKVRNRSEAKNSLMWKEFSEEAWKKSIIRRAQKTWPRIASAALFQRAVEVLNDNEALDTRTDRAPDAVVVLSDEQVLSLHAIVTDAGGSSQAADELLSRLARLYGCVEIAEVPASNYDEAAERMKAKVAELKAKRENKDK